MQEISKVLAPRHEPKAVQEISKVSAPEFRDLMQVGSVVKKAGLKLPILSSSVDT